MSTESEALHYKSRFEYIREFAVGKLLHLFEARVSIHAWPPDKLAPMGTTGVLRVLPLRLLRAGIALYLLNMKQEVFQNVVWKEGKYFVAQCLNIDVSSFGNTREEALANLDEAINLLLEDKTHAEVQAIENPEIVNLSVKYA